MKVDGISEFQCALRKEVQLSFSAKDIYVEGFSITVVQDANVYAAVYFIPIENIVST